MEFFPCSQEGVDQVPEFRLFEEFLFEGLAIGDLVEEDEGEIVIFDLDYGEMIPRQIHWIHSSLPS